MKNDMVRTLAMLGVCALALRGSAVLHGDVWVAAADSSLGHKESADFVCPGKHDEVTIQRAVEKALAMNGNVRLANGVYRIDGFRDFGDKGPWAAICLPRGHRDISFCGENPEYGFCKSYANGVTLRVSSDAWASLSKGETDVLRGGWSGSGCQNGSSLRIENIAIVLPDNQHAIRCIDLRRVDRVEVKGVTLIAYGDLFGVNDRVPLHDDGPVPVLDCIGLTMTDGSNYNYSDYTHVFAYGFGQGIQVGGEHVVCINCGGACGLYGWTFGNYPAHCGLNHPITLINCLDERNVNFPLFNRCGDNGGSIRGNQEVTMIGFNCERIEGRVPGGKLGHLMKEVVPGSWRGNIGFTWQPKWAATNSVHQQLWEPDGSGSGFVTRNNAHRLVCPSAERRQYAPYLGQTVFDLDLRKQLICIDPVKRTWVDALGHEVE